MGPLLLQAPGICTGSKDKITVKLYEKVGAQISGMVHLGRLWPAHAIIPGFHPLHIHTYTKSPQIWEV